MLVHTMTSFALKIIYPNMQAKNIIFQRSCYKSESNAKREKYSS